MPQASKDTQRNSQLLDRGRGTQQHISPAPLCAAPDATTDTVLLTIVLPPGALSSAPSTPRPTAIGRLTSRRCSTCLLPFVIAPFLCLLCRGRCSKRQGGAVLAAIGLVSTPQFSGGQAREGLQCRRFWSIRATSLFCEVHMTEVRRGSREMSDPRTPSSRVCSPR